MHRGYATVEGVKTLAEAPSDVLETLEYQSALQNYSFGDFLRFMLSTFDRKKALKEEKNQPLWSPILNEGDEEQHKKKRDAGNAKYTSRREPVVEHLYNDGRRMLPAET